MIINDLTEANRLAQRSDNIHDKLKEFAQSVTIDSARNVDVLQPIVRSWIQQQPSLDFDALNTRVYEELFLTPASDPWLGLADLGYTALPNGGLVRP